MRSYLAIIALALTGCVTPPQERSGTENTRSTLPRDSLADTVLTRDTLRTLKAIENAFVLSGEPGISTFGLPKIAEKRIVQLPDKAGAWREEWTLKRKGYHVVYKVKFTPSPQGGTDIVITPPSQQTGTSRD